LLAAVGAGMRELVSHDDWLDDAFARPNAKHYQQYLLHLDPAQRFSIVSFVWGPGQATPVHDHTVWGVIGVLRGAEVAESFEADADGRIEPRGEPEALGEGAVAFVSPRIGDVHRVRNAFDDRVSISIHVYGANIGAVRRFVYGPEGRKEFVSGYANAPAGQAN
jgi:predicted metal-dependent enzyme (double-stranded beta helix superfamily)